MKMAHREARKNEQHSDRQLAGTGGNQLSHAVEARLN